MIVSWLVLLAFIWCFTGELGYTMSIVFRGGDLHGISTAFAVPFIGGFTASIPAEYPPTWYTRAVWVILFLWPAAMLANTWLRKDTEKMKWTFVLSSIGYAIFFFAVIVFTVIGLAGPFMYC